MEMHQVRYFLAVARTLNFTRAAEECNVAQPSLTRAIKQLEGELGGDLFRRERPAAQLTELGERMLPLLRQCYESAVAARALASSVKTGKVGSLRLALSRTVDLSLILPQLLDIRQHFGDLEMKLLRGTAQEVAEFLKKGEAELAIAPTLDDDWDRLDRWPLFTEKFTLLSSARHRLADRPSVDISDLREEVLLVRPYCERITDILAVVSEKSAEPGHSYEIGSDRDMLALLEADVGVAVVARTLAVPHTLKRADISGLEVSRTVHLYGVAGRQRTPVASTIMKMLRSADWSRYLQ
jgi:DNA-binding transcriptional LysR family regulator